MAQDGYGTEFRKQFENLTTIERVAEPALKGRKVYDTDLDRIFVGDGTNWNEIPNAGDLGNEYIETNFLSNIVPATANTSLTDNDNTNPLGLKFSDMRYQAGRTRIEAYSIELTDEYIDNKPTYKIAAGCGPKGFRNQVRFVGQGWQNQVSTYGARVNTLLEDDYIIITGLFDDIAFIAGYQGNAPDSVDVQVDEVDTGTDLDFNMSAALAGYNIRPNVLISDDSISTAIGSYGLHTIKITNKDSGSNFDWEIFGFELITTTPIEQAGKAFVGTNETDFTQQTVSDPTITGTKGGKAIRYIDPADSTRKWATQEPDQATVSTTLTSAFNTGTNSLTVADSSDFAVDNLISVHSDDAGYTINELFRVSSIGSSTNITVQDVSTVTDRAGAGYNFPIGTTIEHYGNCDTAVDHSNEVISRSSHPRRFGAGHADDWQDVNSYGAKSFTLDDGSCSLWSDDSGISALVGQLQAQKGVFLDDTDGTDGVITFIFNGTGVALDFNVGDAAQASGDIDIFLDGTKIQDAYALIVNSIYRLDLASNLPNQTHIVQLFNRDATAAANVGSLVRFIEYIPKDSSVISALDKGSLIAKKQLTADYVFNSGTDIGDFSKGVTYYAPNRGWKLTDSSTAWAIGNSVEAPFYKDIYSKHNGTAAVAERWFYGTGFELGLLTYTDRCNPYLELDGSTDFSSYDLHYPLSGNLIQNNPMTVQGYNTTYEARKFGVTGLTLGWHKLKVTSNTLGGSDYKVTIASFGVIGGSACITEPTQSLQQISSCMIGDSQDIRKIKALESEENVPNYASAQNITATFSTTSTSYVPITDATVNITTKGNPIRINFQATLYNTTTNAYMRLVVFIDGIEYSTMFSETRYNGGSGQMSFPSTSGIYSIPAGTHTITAYLKVSVGTGYVYQNRHSLTVEEMSGVKNED